ncbi:hypothetical protein [Microbacterium album]|uniref:Htaa domain-containing protein n=1 Tax=Microbacterium album TaxID=2053191 RepID=A0A917IIE1_9MICO|nr:hypothetical protein [Microbacterium album]GGH51344.1 hypothetical protein GCM10010921_30710 [Microbacterium album]
MRRNRLVAALALALGLLVPGTAAVANGPEDITVTIPEAPRGPGPSGDGVIENAQLRWGINDESGSAAFAGGCNFLSAGRAGDAGGARVWTEADGLYRSSDGAVRIQKPTSAGTWTAATWQNRCLDPSGRVVSLNSRDSVSGNQVVIEGGTGRLTPEGLRIAWRGSFTVVFYGGMTYWSASDPVLTLDARGDGRLTATANGYGASMDDLTKWDRLPEREIVLAEIRGNRVVTQERGLVATPEYRGVTVSLPDGYSQLRQGADWGSFPQSFVDYQVLTGQAAYWYSSGGVRDPAKPATDLYVSYDAGAAIDVPPPASAGGGSTDDAPVNPTTRRPTAGGGSGAAAAAPPAVEAAAEFFSGLPLMFQPGREGLVPDGFARAIPPVVAPLLGTALALLIGIVAVLNMMGALPWQRPGSR